MALELSRFFDSVDGDKTYSADEFAEYFRSFLTDGVKGLGENVKVSANNTGLKVSVNYGVAMIQGYLYVLKDDSNGLMELTLQAADTQKRIDRVILRLDKTAQARKISLVVKKGTPSASPVPPELTRSGNVFEISLAQINVTANTLSINASDVIDERGNKDVCGIINSDIMLSEINNKADKLLSAVAGNIAILNSDGNYKDSGKNIDYIMNGLEKYDYVIAAPTSSATQKACAAYVMTGNISTDTTAVRNLIDSIPDSTTIRTILLLPGVNWSALFGDDTLMRGGIHIIGTERNTISGGSGIQIGKSAGTTKIMFTNVTISSGDVYLNGGVHLFNCHIYASSFVASRAPQNNKNYIYNCTCSNGQNEAATALATMIRGLDNTDVYTSVDKSSQDQTTGTCTFTCRAATTDPTVTYTNRTGYWVKTGKLVTVTGDLRFKITNAGSGAATLSGLPFTPKHATPVTISRNCYCTTSSPDYAEAQGTSIQLQTMSGGGLNSETWAVNTTSYDGYLYFTVTYEIA